MSKETSIQRIAEFEVEATAGDTARIGTQTVDEVTIRTPNIFPVINFYGGGRSSSLFGGGTHRTVKELINGDERVDGVDCSHLFEGAMMSVGSLTDYGIHRNLLKEYLCTPIKGKPEFHGFDGLLFTDSGGYKNLTQNELDGSDFEIDINQARVFEMQRDLGGEILVNLDIPIEPDDTYEERLEKARETARNADEFLELSKNYPAARYLTVHGYDYSMIETFLTEMQGILGGIDLESTFDGIALGSLVPKKDDRETLIDAVQGCREVMQERGIESLPLHVFGISNTAIPLLIAAGADTFDSSSYMQAAINGKYYKSFLETVHIDEAEFTACNCPVCSSAELRSRMNGDVKYRKDQMGPVAAHNLYVQMNEISEIRRQIEQNGTDGLISYLDDTLVRDHNMKKHALRVINDSLGGYSL